ncbi:hypothetical protein GCM10009119_37970 [Algoriphagus jejuensis]|uniref:Uncharacterized protein n=1 Tax=Algoriphagus jejuensis TaxID=419934 RepID=A0ABN1N4I3_9BACT
MGRTSFLNYYKTILEKVSFDAKLVEKEYRKAKQFLRDPEKQELDAWLETTGLIHKLPPLALHEKAAGQSLPTGLQPQAASPAMMEISVY